VEIGADGAFDLTSQATPAPAIPAPEPAPASAPSETEGNPKASEDEEEDNSPPRKFTPFSDLSPSDLSLQLSVTVEPLTSMSGHRPSLS
jgi:hypothetical protein